MHAKSSSVTFRGLGRHVLKIEQKSNPSISHKAHISTLRHATCALIVPSKFYTYHTQKRAFYASTISLVVSFPANSI